MSISTPIQSSLKNDLFDSETGVKFIDKRAKASVFKKYVDLALRGLIGYYHHKDGFYFYPKETKIFTVSFYFLLPSKINPMVSNELQDFVKKWCLRDNISTKEDMERYLFKYLQPMSGSVSVPIFLSEELLNDLNKIKSIVYTRITDMMKKISCPVCYEQFETSEKITLHQCQHCGSKFIE